LHEAVYKGNTPPRVWRGEIQPVSYGIDDLAVREGWRFFIDALSNKHHADMHGLNIVTSPALHISPELLKCIEPLQINRQFERIDVQLPATVYTRYLDLQFVIGLRRQRHFWDSLEDVEKKENKSAALADHMRLISEEFAEYLSIQKNRPDLVTVPKARILTSYTDQIATGATIGAVIGATLSMPHELVNDTLGFLKLIAPSAAIAGVGRIAHVVIEGFFSSQLVENPDFRDFMTDLGEAGKEVRGD
jgi:hypothetical protein